MNQRDPHSLASLVADRITDRTGRVWDEDARLRLTRWLTDPECQYVAEEWLRLIASPEESDPNERQFMFRKMMSDVLAGASFPTVRRNAFTSRTNWWLPWRRRARRSPDPGR